jgi:hypothetical protein
MMCIHLRGFGPTFALILVGLSYLGLSLLIQHRLRTTAGEEAEAESLSFLSRGLSSTVRFIAFIMKGKINNPTTNMLRNLDRVLIVCLVVGIALAIYADWMAPHCGFIS